MHYMHAFLAPAWLACSFLARVLRTTRASLDRVLSKTAAASLRSYSRGSYKTGFITVICVSSLLRDRLGPALGGPRSHDFTDHATHAPRRTHRSPKGHPARQWVRVDRPGSPGQQARRSTAVRTSNVALRQAQAPTAVAPRSAPRAPARRHAAAARCLSAAIESSFHSSF